MRKREYDYFSIWLGITVLGVAILAFFVLIKYRPDFFRELALIF